jgi:flagellar biosynthetic protein FliR
VHSYQTIPVGSGGLSPEAMLDTVLGSMEAAFHASTKVAMPALVAFFIATLTSGLMGRSMPQLNMMTVGVSINLIVGFIMVGLGLTTWALISKDSLVEMFKVIRGFSG